MRESADRYSDVSIALHWGIALLILANAAVGLLLAPGPSAETLFPLHTTLGLSVLALSLARLGWRLAHPWPPLPAAMRPWERLLARLTHGGFYALMIGVPLLGWWAASADPRADSVSFFGLPAPLLPVERSRELRGALGDWHGAAVAATVGLVVLHVAGAVKHTYVERGGVLARMIPSMRAPGAQNPAARPPGVRPNDVSG